MKLIINNKTIEIEEPSAQQIIDIINEHASKENFFSHFIADGVEVFDKPEQFLVDKLKSVQKLEVVTKTVAQFTNDVLLSAEQYINNAKPELPPLIDEFYQNPTEETWHKLIQFIEGIQWIMHTIETISNLEKQPDNFPAYLEIATTLQEQLAEFEDALENQDNVLIADLIQYEIVPSLDSLLKKITTTIDKIGIRPDAN